MLRILLASVSLAIISVFPALADCVETRVTLRSDGGQAAFTVEVADDDDERSLGLMHRESMPRFSGMLFDFESPQRAVFWMENTLIPLDMLFIDQHGTVQRIHENAIPLDRTAIDGGDGIRFVLEINGGMASMLGIEEGAQMRHPRVPQASAVWACE